MKTDYTSDYISINHIFALLVLKMPSS